MIMKKILCVKSRLVIIIQHDPVVLLSPAFRESGGIRQSVLLSVRPFVCPSVTKTLTWLISSEVLMIEH